MGTATRVDQTLNFTHSDKAALKADKHVAKELDVSAKDVDKAVQEAASEVS